MGKLEITGSGLPGETSIRLDGQDLAPALRGLRLDIGIDRLPTVELDMMIVEVTRLDIEHVEALMPPAAEALLKAAGWTPPGASERAAIVELIKGYFAAVDDPLYEDVKTLCGRIERGEHMPAKED